MTLRNRLSLLCHRCGESFSPDEYGLVSYCIYEDGAASIARHRECELRMVVGSVGHQLGLCSCFGGTYEDPPELTERQAAKRAADMWEDQMRRDSR